MPYVLGRGWSIGEIEALLERCKRAIEDEADLARWADDGGRQ